MSIYEELKPISLDEVHTYPLESRPSKVTVADFAKTVNEESSLSDYLSSLPNILAVQNLREIASRIHRAHRLGKPIIWGIGGHVIKTGLAPVIIDLGPEGGAHGGRVVASGTPEEVAAVKRSHTGKVLKPLLNGNGKRNGAPKRRN